VTDAGECAVILLLQEDVVGGQKHYFALFVVQLEEHVQINVRELELAEFAGTTDTVVAVDEFFLFEFFEAVVFLEFIELELIVLLVAVLLLTETDFTLETGVVFVFANPVEQLFYSHKRVSAT
jgi:hypothetical protein